jgi:hypothetical protein
MGTIRSRDPVSHECSDCDTSWSGWPDLNRRPLDPQSSALTKLRHSPCPSQWPFLGVRRPVENRQTQQRTQQRRDDLGNSTSASRLALPRSRHTRLLGSLAVGLPTDPTVATLKRLFALSHNVCAFRDPDRYRGCEVQLASRGWERVNAHVCHIEAAHESGPRYRADMTDEERRDFANLIVLCLNCSNMIDYLEPDRFTVEVLKDMKHLHESRAEADWALREEELIAWAATGLDLQARYNAGEFPSLPAISSVRRLPPTMATTTTMGGAFEMSANAEVIPPARSGLQGSGLQGAGFQGGGGFGSSPYGFRGSGGGEEDSALGSDWSHPVTIQLQQLLGYDHIRADDPLDDGTALIYRTDLTAITDAQAQAVEELSATVARVIRLVNPATGQEWRYP